MAVAQASLATGVETVAQMRARFRDGKRALIDHFLQSRASATTASDPVMA